MCAQHIIISLTIEREIEGHTRREPETRLRRNVIITNIDVKEEESAKRDSFVLCVCCDRGDRQKTEEEEATLVISNNKRECIDTHIHAHTRMYACLFVCMYIKQCLRAVRN